MCFQVKNKKIKKCFSAQPFQRIKSVVYRSRIPMLESGPDYRTRCSTCIVGMITAQCSELQSNASTTVYERMRLITYTVRHAVPHIAQSCQGHMRKQLTCTSTGMISSAAALNWPIIVNTSVHREQFQCNEQMLELLFGQKRFGQLFRVGRVDWKACSMKRIPNQSLYQEVDSLWC